MPATRTLAPSPHADACCGPERPQPVAPPDDDAARTRALVRQAYGSHATARSSCCGSSCSDETTFMAEDYGGLAGYVPDADLGLGCGIPTEHARLRPGETVLDLGSGAGNDVFVAARAVGPSGHALGVDMTPEMVALAQENARRTGVGNASFVLGEIEDLPVDDASIDIVLSNCVLNLVPDKEKAFREIYRVLRPSGRFCISDIVVRGELPEALRQAAALYVGCVAGALDRSVYLALIREAGFEEVDVPVERPIPIPDALLDRHLSPRDAERFRQSGASIASVTVRGRRPGS